MKTRSIVSDILAIGGAVAFLLGAYMMKWEVLIMASGAVAMGVGLLLETGVKQR